MELLMVLSAFMSYLCFSLLAGRHWYGKWRIEEAEKRAGVRKYKVNEEAWSDGKTAGLAAFTGLFWPVTGPAYAVRWLIMSHPPLAQHEIEEQKAAERARHRRVVVELEDENEIAGRELKG